MPSKREVRLDGALVKRRFGLNQSLRSVWVVFCCVTWGPTDGYPLLHRPGSGRRVCSRRYLELVGQLSEVGRRVNPLTFEELEHVTVE